MFANFKRQGIALCLGAAFILMATPSAQAGKLLDEMKVEDTCGTTYADKLASCTPFRCQKPSPMAMMFGFPSEEALQKMPPERQQKIRKAMASAEKQLEAVSPEALAANKAKMISTLEIKGPDAEGRCRTTTVAIPGQQMDCAFDRPLLARTADYTRLAATAEHIQVKSESHLVDGKMVTEQIDTIDGKEMSNPWKEALDNGQCKMADATRSGGKPASSGPQQAANAGQGANTLFIIDASGSMWGRIDGKPKISIAKEVLNKLVAEIPDRNRIGLIAYGHRRKGDCNDVETLVRLGGNNKQSVLNAVRGLNAKGKTPLTESVNQAIDMLRTEKSASTVVLVSDGIESCGGDPCAAVKAARASGVGFVLHAVGFGLSKKESAQLRCMARAGGGEYFQANNADELLKSTRKAVKSKGPGILKLTLRANGRPVNAWLRVTASGSGDAAVLTNDDGAKPGQSWTLEPGRYRLETYPAGLRGATPMVLRGLKIESGKSIEKTLDFSVATLRLNASENGKPVAVQIRLSNPDTGVTVFDTATFSTFTMKGVKTPYDVHLLPGRYHLVVGTGEPSVAPYEEEIELSADGSVLNKSVSFDAGKLRVLVTLDGKPVTAEVTVANASTQEKVFETMPYVGNETPLTVSLSPAAYSLAAVPAGVAGIVPKTMSDIEVVAGAIKEVSLKFNSPKVATDANGMEQNTDRPGGDYKGFIPAAADPSLCQTVCARDPQCKSWTYVKPNTVMGPQPHCFLKGAVPRAAPSSCCTSGTRAAG